MAQPIKISISADAKGVKAGVDQANAQLNRLNQSAKDSQQSLQNIDKGFSNLTRATAAVGGLYAISQGLSDVTRAASDLEQSSGAIEQVFKGQAGSMAEAAKASVDLGLSTADYGNLAVVLGSQLKNLGFDQDRATEKTQTLIGIGADFAAMYGGTVSQAVESISSALKGQRDPIERYGITITEAMVQAEMSSKGISKAQATINLIMSQGADAIGQWNRESDTFAVKQQKFQAQLENTKAKIGEALLPVMSKAAEAATLFAQAFSAIPAPVYTALTALGLVVVGKRLIVGAAAKAQATLLTYSATVTSTATSTAAMATNSYAAAGGFYALGAAARTSALANLSPTAVAAQGAAGAIGLLSKAIIPATAAWLAWDFAVGKVDEATARAIPSVDSMTRSLSNGSKSVQDLSFNFDTGIWDGVFAYFQGGMLGMTQGTYTFAEAVERVYNRDLKTRIIDALPSKTDYDRNKAALEDVGTAIANIPDPTEKAQAWETYREALKRAGATSQEIAEIQAKVVPELEEIDEAASGVAKSYDEAARAASDFRSALAGQTQQAVDLDVAQSNYLATIADIAGTTAELTSVTSELGPVVTAGGAALDTGSEAGRKAQDSLLKLRDSSFDVIEAMRTQRDVAGNLVYSTDDLKNKVAEQREEFIRQALQMGLNQQAAEYLANRYGLIPDNVETTINAQTGQANADVDEFGRKTDYATRPRTVKVVVQYDTPAGPPLPDGTVMGQRPRRADYDQAIAALRRSRGEPADPTPPRLVNRNIGQVKPKQRLAVNVMIDGKDIPARVLTQRGDRDWSPNLAGPR